MDTSSTSRRVHRALSLLAVLALFSSADAQSVTKLGKVSAGAIQPGPNGETVTWSYRTPANTGVPGDYTQTIRLDAAGNPWVGGYIPFWEQGGMSYWDGSVWTPVTNVDYPTIASPRFNDIVIDAAGMLWIASDDGLLHMDPTVGPTSLVRYGIENTALTADFVRDVALAPDGTVWLAISDPAQYPSGGLAVFDPAAGTWTQYTTANGLPWGDQYPLWDQVDHVTVEPTESGYRVWFSNASLGVGKLENGVFTWFGLNPPPGPKTIPVGLQSTDVIDSTGHIWMSTNNGLARRETDGTFTLVPYPPGVNATDVSLVVALEGGRGGLGTYGGQVWEWNGAWTSFGTWGGSYVLALVEDPQGRLWTGGIGGAARYENGAWQRYRVTNTGMLGYFMHTVAFAPNGDVYMNGNASAGVGGFSFTDGVNWTCVNDSNYGLGPPWGLLADDVQGLHVRSNGRLILALIGGYGMYEWDGSTYTQLGQDFTTIDYVTEDALGRAWGTTHYGGSLYLNATGQESQYTLYTTTNSPLPGGGIGSLVTDDVNPGYVWIGNQFDVVQTDGTTWNIYPRELWGLSQNTTSELLTVAEPVPDGTFWVGSAGNGLYHYHPATDTYERYTTANSGLPADTISQLELAPDGTLWVATFDNQFLNGGLSRFDGSTWTTWSAGTSPLPHNQIADLAARSIPGGFEVWVATASEGIAVVTVR